MRGRCVVVGCLAGTGAVHGLAVLPPWLPVAGAGAAAALLVWLGVVLALRYSGRRPRVGAKAAVPGQTAGALLLLLLLGLLVGAGQTAYRAQWRLADALAVQHENLVTRVTFQIVSLATGDASYQQFEARVVHSPVAGVPQRLRVGWPAQEAEPLPVLIPGDVYSAALLLKRPHGLANPRAFDAEAWMFERDLRARATVRGTPQRLAQPGWVGAGVAVQRWRHAWRAALRERLGDARYGAVIIALALGDQASVAAADWEVFSRTGIIHLVSISGLHVTLLAGLAGAAALALWKRLAWRGLALAEVMPAQVAGAVAALLTAWAYCLLAGWGVPAQRTFFMLATVGLAAILRLPISASRLLLLAALAVVVLDPWAMLSPGFWLSFGAVAVLMLLGTGRWQQPQASVPRWRRALHTAAVVQAAMTLALVPLLALQFHEVSLASPLANALAIPVVSFVVTPLALVGMLLAPWPVLGVAGGWLAQLAEWVFRLMMWPIAAMAGSAWATWPVAAPPAPAVVLALLGVVYAVLPAGPPWRPAGWALMLPLFFWQPPRLAAGEWRLQVLDVGQGSAAVIQTRHHVLVFDVGPPFGGSSDAGDRVVWPWLRAQGLRRVHEVMVSHADSDHVGGLHSVLQRVPVQRLRAPDPLNLPDGARSRINLARSVCQAGQGWQWDGVTFRVLHPAPGDAAPPGGQGRNDRSCVLLVQGWWHAALLPGDIEASAERTLTRADAGALQADVVLMPHHGSLTSSSAALVGAVRPQHAVAQAGYLSRFGHPRAEVVARWQAAGALVHNTASTGALSFVSGPKGLRWQAQRQAYRRYWHHGGR